MARPKSDDRENAIMAAAIRLIASQGLGAATAAIAKEAGVSNGSLFTYFPTKADLLNRLYLELKGEIAAASLGGLPTESDIREQVFYMWSHWLGWAISYPEKRRTLTLLDVSDDITPESHQAARDVFAGIRTLLERSRENGPMRDAPLEFVVVLMNALAEATINFIIHDPTHIDQHSVTAFEAFWRMVD